jgi:hypothetical protein
VSLEVSLAVYVLPIRAWETSDQRVAKADRPAAMAGEAIGERDDAMLRAGAGVHDAVAATQQTRREQQWSQAVDRSMSKERAPATGSRLAQLPRPGRHSVRPLGSLNVCSMH